MNINNKTIWITGASSGIGEALAIECARQGAILILSARNKEKLQLLKSQLVNSDQHRVLPLDLSEPENLATQVAATIESNTIDILINNGGISQRGSARNTNLSVQRQVMEVNYFGTIALTQCVLPKMLAAKTGMIVTVSSVAGKIGGQSMSGYSASKHAIIGYMDCLRAERKLQWLTCINDLSWLCPN
ncbi:MAG: SDR family NAD(P)-dependent oxidoreductase [Colwellia sp.]|nr:SDR family NAD(P)-dependent oxidoreductase [Colwellia sp.]